MCVGVCRGVARRGLPVLTLHAPCVSCVPSCFDFMKSTTYCGALGGRSTPPRLCGHQNMAHMAHTAHRARRSRHCRLVRGSCGHGTHDTRQQHGTHDTHRRAARLIRVNPKCCVLPAACWWAGTHDTQRRGGGGQGRRKGPAATERTQTKLFFYCKLKIQPLQCEHGRHIFKKPVALRPFNRQIH